MKIHVIQTGSVEIKKNQVIGKEPKALRLVNVLLGKEWVEPVPIYAWVIEHVSPDPNQAIDTMQNILSFTSQHPTVYLPTHDPNSEERLKNKETLSIH